MNEYQNNVEKGKKPLKNTHSFLSSTAIKAIIIRNKQLKQKHNRKTEFL